MITLIYLFLVYPAYATDADYNVASNHVIAAVYKQSGYETYVNTYAQNLDKKYVPDYINDSGIVAGLLLQCIESHRLGWKWSF